MLPHATFPNVDNAPQLCQRGERKIAFLDGLGFSTIESLPTLVRFRKADIEVHVYHGRQSFEIGFEVVRRGNSYSISEIIRVTDPEAAERYRSFATTTPQGIAEGLAQLEALVKGYADSAPVSTENTAFVWREVKSCHIA